MITNFKNTLLNYLATRLKGYKGFSYALGYLSVTLVFHPFFLCTLAFCLIIEIFWNARSKNTCIVTRHLFCLHLLGFIRMYIHSYVHMYICMYLHGRYRKERPKKREEGCITHTPRCTAAHFFFCLVKHFLARIFV